jgi:hypothetical protein
MTTVHTGGSMNLHAALAACFFNPKHIQQIHCAQLNERKRPP